MVNDLYRQRREQMFPRLDAAQLARIERHGKRLETGEGDVLSEPGERRRRFFVVLNGSLELLVRGLQGEDSVHLLRQGEFTGELSLLRGVGGFGYVRVREAGTVLALEDERLRALVQTDAELGEIIMRAFMLRRMGLVGMGDSEVAVIGSRHSAHTLRLREFLTRNYLPHASVDVDTDGAAMTLAGRSGVRRISSRASMLS